MEKYKINNKFHKNELIMKDPFLKQHIPETNILTKNHLTNLLIKHKKVVVKPSRGSLGNGVIMINEINPQEYELLYPGKKPKYIKGIEVLYTYLKKLEHPSIPCIVQYYIPLAKILGSPFDLRYISQLYKNEWLITGMYGRIAKKGYAVTNFEHGSKIITVDEALKISNIKNLELIEFQLNLEKIVLSISRCLHEYFTKQTIWGLDIGIDEKGEIYVIEVNAAPQTKGFLELESLKPMYRNIHRIQNETKK
ncbi:YheC/YheD family protein [Metabacillus niabensis]|uniref:YheC/YheD family protein n=1 Tax=Metabacillus niabensis TaxID=324854 RepID=UPI001CF9699A|nr:YheC/YheD family protein [Metabacillus niabensis]